MAKIIQHVIPPAPPGSFHLPPDDQYLFIALITVATVLLYRLLSYDVRRAWLRYARGIPNPHEEHFERLYRIQMNTLEHIIFFLPSLWLCAFYFSIPVASVLGLIWVIGRGWYAIGYFTTPSRPPVGFHIAMLASLLIFAGGAGGVCYRIPLHPYIPDVITNVTDPLIGHVIK